MDFSKTVAKGRRLSAFGRGRIESNMSDKVKKLAPIIWQEIGKSTNILLHCHPSPDPDSLGSTLALMHVLRRLGKNVTVIKGDSELRPSLYSLPGCDQVEKKNFFEIDPSQLDLFLILDSSDKSQISKKREIVFPENLRTIVIDHHASNKEFGQINLVDSSYSSVCQMVANLLEIWKIELHVEEATCLLMGIYTDSGGFRYFPTNSDTFLTASKLAKVAPDYYKEISLLENSNEPEQLVYLQLALSSVEKFFDGKVAMSFVTNKQLAENKIMQRHTEKMEVSNLLKSVIGCQIGIALTEVEKNMVNISFRTRDSDKYDVSKIAVATGFGGGHKAAAGARLPMSLRKAKEFLLETIKNTYPDLVL